MPPRGAGISFRQMSEQADRIRVGDRVKHEGREGYVRHVYPSGVCWVDFAKGGGVSAPMKDLELVERAAEKPGGPD